MILFSTSKQVFTHIFAVSMLIVLIICTVIFWPFEILPILIDEQGIVLEVDELDYTDLHVGDQVVEMYNISWDDISKTFFPIPFDSYKLDSVPMKVLRSGEIINIYLPRKEQSIRVIYEKCIAFFISFTFWLVGYYISVSKRHNIVRSDIVGSFWFMLGGMISLYYFSLNMSILLSVFSKLLLLFLFSPLFFVNHLYHPVSLVGGKSRWWYFSLASGIIFSVCSFCILYFSNVSIILVNQILANAVPLLLLVPIACSAIIVMLSYSKSVIERIRRDIRIIIFAYISVIVIWLIMRMIPVIFGNEYTYIHYTADIFAILIPISYIVSGMVLDNYIIDRYIRLIVSSLISLLVCTVIVYISFRLIGIKGLYINLWASLFFMLAYYPISRIVRRLMGLDHREHISNKFRHGFSKISEVPVNREPTYVISIFDELIDERFHPVSRGFYIADKHEQYKMHLVSSKNADLPHEIRNPHQVLYRGIVDIGVLKQVTNDEFLNIGSASGITLLCFIDDSNGDVIGLFLLGHQAGFDPYRDHDAADLQQCLNVLRLSLINRFIHQEQRDAEYTIRALYHKVQNIGSETASSIARDIHDEVINLNLRLNIVALERLQALVSTNHQVTAELGSVIDSHRTAVEMLRMICQQLYVRSIDDPFGLPNAFRQLIDSVRFSFDGQINLNVKNHVHPIPSNVQNELYRIAREAITNSIKHSHANVIYVTVEYHVGSSVYISVEDDGNGSVDMMHRNNLGIRSMIESAQSIGAKLVFSQMNPGISVSVLCNFIYSGEECNVEINN